jgi:hypothetical protein
MNKFLVVLALTLTLVGCNTHPDLSNSYFNMYVGTEGANDLYFLSGSRPKAVIYNGEYDSTFYMPLLTDENIYGTWYVEDNPLFKLDKDLHILANNTAGVFSGNYQWLYTNAIVIRFTHLNSEELEEPFYQMVIFDSLTECDYEFHIFTFGVEQSGVASKCKLESS